MASQEDQQQPHTILVAFENTLFQHIKVSDYSLSARQILAMSGYPASDDFSLYRILSSGDFEDVFLDAIVDLRRPGADRFIIFKSDRDFKLTVNQRQVLWGLPTITGTDLYALSAPADGEAVYLVCPGSENRAVERDDTIDLTPPGVEHFITAPKRPMAYEIFVNGRKTTVHDSRVTFEQLVELAFPGVPPQPNVTYSITFRKVASFPHEGELAAGAFVEVKNGSIFNVSRTVQS